MHIHDSNSDTFQGYESEQLRQLLCATRRELQASTSANKVLQDENVQLKVTYSVFHCHILG